MSLLIELTFAVASNLEPGWRAGPLRVHPATTTGARLKTDQRFHSGGEPHARHTLAQDPMHNVMAAVSGYARPLIERTPELAKSCLRNNTGAPGNGHIPVASRDKSGC